MSPESGVPQSQGPEASTSRTKAALALVGSVPAPTIGTLAAMVFLPGTVLGQAVYVASKLWLAGFPLGWRALVERAPLSLSPVRRGGYAMAVATGLGISIVIVAAWFAALALELIDPAMIREAANENGIGTPLTYIGFSLYIICVNSLLEEYFWRWFVFRRCEDLLRSGAGAVILSGFLFTLHHIIALKVQMDWLPTVLASVGIFCGGVIWSWMYLRYRSIWPAYISHAIVDLAFLIIGYVVILHPPSV